MSGRAARAGAIAVVVSAAAMACSSGTAGSPEGQESRSPEAAETAAPPTTEPADPRTTTPLALAVHPTRTPLDVRPGLARRLLAGRVHDWRALGAPSARLRVVAAPGTPTARALQVRDARAALRAVATGRAGLAIVPATAVGPGVRVLTVGGRHPLRGPAAYPLQVAGPAPGRVVTAAVVGDLMLGRRVGERLAADEDFAAALRPTARRLAAADLTVGNLEGTLSRHGRPRQGGDSFGADPRVRAGLRLAGFDVLSLANNHAGDFGPSALVQTVRRVRAAGIAPVGAGAGRREARRPVVVRRGGLRFGVVAFDAIGETPAAGPGRPGANRVRMQPRTGPLDRGDLARVTADVRTLRPHVDVLLVLPHWGTQYTTRTVRDQRVVGRTLVRAGADLVVGSHPHWVQGVELNRGRLIAYSLGNFVFDMDFSRQTREGVILELTFWDDQLKAADLVPVRIGGDFAPRVTSGGPARAVLARLRAASGPPLTGSHSRAVSGAGAAIPR